MSGEATQMQQYGTVRTVGIGSERNGTRSRVSGVGARMLVTRIETGTQSSDFTSIELFNYESSEDAEAIMSLVAQMETQLLTHL